MSSSSSPPSNGSNPPPSSSGPPSNGNGPPGLPPNGSNPPPPPPTNSSSSGSITSANYFFGFVVTFVVLLLLFVGCGIGSWRRFRLMGTAWDVPLQAMDRTSFGTRKRGRRRLVRPVFWETWTAPPKALMMSTSTATSGLHNWEGVQPISATLIWSRSKLAKWSRKVDVDTSAITTTAGGVNGSDESGRGLGATLRMYVFPRRPRCEHPARPPPTVERPPPDAIQVAVMIAMPSPPSASVTVCSPRGLCGAPGGGGVSDRCHANTLAER
ncbi:hypothetical protein JVU11DRAFT_5799 [Chiua virens]|nr:hypothetical protein JVU11DRAFT_5799 [Chiua virens]